MSMEDQNGTSKILSMPNPASQKPTSALYPVAEQHNPFEDTATGTNIGLISSDSLLNIASSSLSNSISLIPNPKLSDQQIQSHPLRQFIDVCRKTNSDHSAVTWPEIEESNSDRTQLSISIPMACSDFSSSSSSNHDKLALSPLRLSREHDPIPMGLGVGLLNEVCHHHANWRPISWEASLAGPLGEVLNNTNSTPRDQSRNFLSSTSQNILSDGWDSRHQMESSPTGVLQKNSFSSLSSSTGSSPRAGSLKIHENNGSLCNNLLGSAIEVQQMR